MRNADFPPGQDHAQSREVAPEEHDRRHDEHLNDRQLDTLQDAIPINEVPRRLPRRGGKKVHISTVWRWVNRGVRGVKLESLTIGGRRYVRPEALEVFLEALNRPQTAAPQPQQPTQRRREAERAAREVARILGERGPRQGVA